MAWTFINRIFLYGSVGIFLGLLGRWHWIPDLFSHFLPQQLFLLLIFTLAMVLQKQWKKAAVAGVIFLSFSSFLFRYVPSFVMRSDVAGLQQISILYINVNSANKRDDLVSRLIKDRDPDILVISEINERWDRALAPIVSDYPFYKIENRNDNFGIAFYSRLPLRDIETVYLGRAQVPSIRAVLSVSGREFIVWATHPVPPVSTDYWQMRNEQFALLAKEFAGDPRPKIVIGDLNAAPWCGWFKTVKGDLKDTAEGIGFQPSWPSFWPAVLRVSIDHVLVSREIWVLGRKVMGHVGSDHLPVFVRLGV